MSKALFRWPPGIRARMGWIPGVSAVTLLATTTVFAEPPEHPQTPTDVPEAPGPDVAPAPSGAREPVPSLHRERAIPLELGPDFGVSWRPARGTRAIRYPAAFSWGVHAGIELNRWLGVRLLVDHTRQPVSADPGAFAASAADAELEQPAIELWRLAARLEPSYHFAPRWRLFAGLGGGWTTLEARAMGGELPGCAPLVPEAGCALTAPRRRGKLAELTASLGVSAVVVPDWLLFVANGSYGIFASESGTLFDTQQGFAGGRMLMLRGLPEFAAALTFTAGLGLVL